MSGALVLVATPIGNLGDLAPRAVAELEGADLVCCEDTRRTGTLLRHAGVRVAELRRLDEHTEFDSIPAIVERVAAGARVVLVSDAGTPAISDPGQRLVAAVIAAGLTVTGVPGPVAAVQALVLSGLDTDRFVFEGFLNRKGSVRDEQLEAIAAQRRTTVFYESPNRLAATLRELAALGGADRQAVVARELTKLHEELKRGTLNELADWADQGVRGEVVVVVSGAAPPAEADDAMIVAALGDLLTAGRTRRDAIDEVTASTGARRSRVYDLALTVNASAT